MKAGLLIFILGILKILYDGVDTTECEYHFFMFTDFEPYLLLN